MASGSEGKPKGNSRIVVADTTDENFMRETETARRSCLQPIEPKLSQRSNGREPLNYPPFHAGNLNFAREPSTLAA